MLWYGISKAPESITSSIIEHPLNILWTSLGWTQWSWLCLAMSFGTKSQTWRQGICSACWSISEDEVDMDSMDCVMIVSQNRLKCSARFQQGKSRQDLHWELHQHCAWHYRTCQLQSWIGCGLDCTEQPWLCLFPERRVCGLSIDQLCMICWWTAALVMPCLNYFGRLLSPQGSGRDASLDHHLATNCTALPDTRYHRLCG